MIKDIRDVLNRDFIILMCKIKMDRIDGKPISQENLDMLTKLAELGNINALAYYYQFCAPKENSVVDKNLLSSESEEVFMDIAMSNYQYASIDKQAGAESVNKIKAAFKTLGDKYNEEHDTKEMDKDCDPEAFEKYVDIIAEDFETQPFFDGYRLALNRACNIAYDTDDNLNEAEYYEMCDRVFEVLPFESLFDMWDMIDIIEENRRELAYQLLDKYNKFGSIVYGYACATMLLDPKNAENDFYNAFGYKILKEIAEGNKYSEKISKYEICGRKSSSAPQ